MKNDQTKPNEIKRKQRRAGAVRNPPFNNETLDSLPELIARHRHMSGLMCPPVGAVLAEKQRIENQG